MAPAVRFAPVTALSVLLRALVVGLSPYYENALLRPEASDGVHQIGFGRSGHHDFSIAI